MDRVKYEYDVVLAIASWDELADACTAKLTAGWTAQGGVSVSYVNGNFWYAQAFVREVPREGDE